MRKLKSFLSKAAIAAIWSLFGCGYALADNYGAIAYSPSTGAHGYSYDFPSRGQAETRALAECRARGRGCKIAVWYVNACGALATGSNGWGSAWAGTRSAAESRAVRQCARFTRNCRVLAWSCTSR
jgi:hypothetical protein